MLNERCLHGIEKEVCAQCSGLMEQKEQERVLYKKYKTTDARLIELKTTYETEFSKYINNGEDWTEEEIDMVYLELIENEPKGIQKKRTVYELAIVLGRSIKSIMWHYKMLKYPNKNMHRGKNVIDYLKSKGIESENG